MDYIAPYFKMSLAPVASPEAVVVTGKARFTVLADRLIRIEYAPEGVFEDRASQAIWYRSQPTPVYAVKQSEEELVIETAALRLHYRLGATFAFDTLWIDLKAMETIWHFDDADPGNLGGTARTLDGVNGATPISLGLVSRSGWSLVDDSGSLVFDDVSWLGPRLPVAGQLDLYFMGYGHDYLGALRDFNRISGSVPMIPRFVLGNWWSRYWEYSHDELIGLMNDFHARQIPLSVCIIDMDWHVTATGNESSGWTGYTWNRKLFPHPEDTLRQLHDKGLKVALNLHPADGVYPHEEMYKEMAEAVGMDSSTSAPVAFDIAEPRFVDAYFRILHHPMEAQGVDFWWMDWQQGQKSGMAGLDPLWWLNHLHFYDLARDGNKRSFIFSRWGGLGNHRYPIGFSGDTIVSWESLAFQPYFTATASNVNYGWWSHDIGGHMGGIEDGELNARWVQFGAFQPVLRIHSTKSPFQDRRPWAYDADSYEVTRDALQLRHTLIPYLYSMAWRYHKQSVPPLLPMYYNHPETEAAYACPNQYMFGDQLVVAPFISPRDYDTRLSRIVAWLPEGDWFNLFTGQYYAGGATHAIYGTLSEIPVFAKAGAIVPLAPVTGESGVNTPNKLIVNIFPGADGKFELYDDEGNTNDYLQGAYAITPMTQTWGGNTTTLTIGPAQKQTGLVPEQRQYDLVFRGFAKPESVSIYLNDKQMDVKSTYYTAAHTLTIVGLTVSPSDELMVRLTTADDLTVREDTRMMTCMKLLNNFHMGSWLKDEIHAHLDEIMADTSKLVGFLPFLKGNQLRALLETITEAGIDLTQTTGSPLIVVWNNHEDGNVTLTTTKEITRMWWLYKDHHPASLGTAPRFQSFKPKTDFDPHSHWMTQLHYGVLYSQKFTEKDVVEMEPRE